MGIETGFSTPTLSELIQRVRNDYVSLGIPEAKLPRSLPWAATYALAGVAYGLYGFLHTVAREMMPDTATSFGVLRWASIFGLVRIPASAAVVRFTVFGTTGLVLPANTRWVREDGLEYELSVPSTLIAPGLTVVNVACTTTGVIGDCEPGTPLTLMIPIAGITSEVAVTSTITDGADIETLARLLQRTLDRIRDVPQGGAGVDFVEWVKEAHPAVDRVWTYANELGAGTVVVRFVLDAVGADAIPSAGDVTTVQEYIDEVDAAGNTVRRPVTADVTVVAPVAKAVLLTITIYPDTVANRTAVEEELMSMLAVEQEEPGPAVIKNSLIHAAISRADGEEWHELLAVDGGAGTADITVGVNQWAYLGVVTWV